MLATISQPFGEQIWILTSPNAKTAGNRDTQPFHAKSKMPSMSNVTVSINLNTIENLVGVVKQMTKLTLLD